MCASELETENRLKSYSEFPTILNGDELFNLTCDLYMNNSPSGIVLQQIKQTLCTGDHLLFLSDIEYLYPKESPSIPAEEIWKTVKNDISGIFRRKIRFQDNSNETESVLYTIYLGKNVSGHEIAVGIVQSTNRGFSTDGENRLYDFLGSLKRYYTEFSESPALNNFARNKSAFQSVVNASTNEIVATTLPSDGNLIANPGITAPQLINNLPARLSGTDTKGVDQESLDKQQGNINISNCTIQGNNYTILSFSVANQAVKKTEEHDRIIRNFSHKIRGKLSALQSAASQIDLQKGEIIDDDDIALAGIIQSSTDSLNRLIDRLNLYSHCAASETSSIDVNRLVENIILKKNMESDSPQKIRFDAGLDIMPVKGDSEQINVVIEELINNAIDASLGENSIRISTESDDGKASLIIENEISGRDKIVSGGRKFDFFEPFTSLKSNRAGIGLNIARRIVSNHGGKIKITAGPENKVTVKVDFPASTKGKVTVAEE